MTELLPRLPRVEALIGRRLSEIDIAVVERMVAMRTREDTDLDFKQGVYAQNDKGHQDAATDVAAMANGPGGAIFLGVRDDDGAAVEVTPVAFSEVTELRLRQAIISQTAPAPLFVIHRVPLAAEADRGIYLAVVPPSPYAPHAVRLNVRLGYPRRHGPHTRWLSESEVAEAYRARFITSEQRAERLNVVRNAGQELLAQGAWLTMALVPTVPGSFAVRRRSMNELSEACVAWFQPNYSKRVFTSYPQAEAAVGRIVIHTGRNDGSRMSTSGHAELHSDGSAFAATRVGALIPPPIGEATAWSVDDEVLVQAGIAVGALVLELASRRAGAVGDAYLSASLIVSGTPPELELIHTRQGYRAPFTGAHRVSGVHHSTVLVSLEDAATTQGLLIIARMALTEIFQWFGYPEVPQITDAGKLRRLYIAQHNRQEVLSWAAANGVEIVDTQLELEP